MRVKEDAVGDHNIDELHTLFYTSYVHAPYTLAFLTSALEGSILIILAFA